MNAFFRRVLFLFFIGGSVAYAEPIPFTFVKPLFLFNAIDTQLQMTTLEEECQVASSFNPLQCQQKMFEDNRFFEPYWAQWRVGAQLKDDLLTPQEKDEPVKVGLVDEGLSQESETFQDMMIVCEEGVLGERMCHGTHVASIMCSKDQCSVGEAKGAELYAYKIKGGAWGFDEEVVKTVDHAIDQGVRVINLSLTYFQTPTSPEVTGLLQKIKDNNVMVVWSAGNEYGIEKPFPSNVDNILSISSVDPMLRLSDFSNQGLSTDFAAPSDIQIHSLREEKFSGTSGAAPVVSGVILNMLKVNPALSPIQIKNILKATALDLGPDGFDPQTGWGMPNMAKALLAARYVKEGRLFVSQRSIEDPTELNRLGRRVFIEISKDKRVLPISFEEAVAQSKNCEDYGKNIKKIFMNYFLTEDSTEICKFYTRHKIFLSAITFCPASQQEALKKQLALELWSSDSKRRQEAAYAVGIAQDVASLPKLTALLQDPDSDVRDLALRALGHFPHSPDAATALMRAFPTLSLGEKKAAINSLSKFETHPPAIQFLMSLVSEPLPEENNVLPRLIKEEAIKALGRLKHRESIPILIEQFASEYTLHPVTIEALAQMKEEAIPLLLETLRDIRKRPVEEPHKIEMGIGKTLGAIGAPAIEPILQAVRRKELDVFLVSNAIREIGMPALTPMLSVLEDSDPLVQWVAAKSLGDIGDDRAVEALIQKLHTRNISIQQAVRMSLERIEILTQNEQVRQRIHRALR